MLEKLKKNLLKSFFWLVMLSLGANTLRWIIKGILGMERYKDIYDPIEGEWSSLKIIVSEKQQIDLFELFLFAICFVAILIVLFVKAAVEELAQDKS
jgi:hypothetical protein